MTPDNFWHNGRGCPRCGAKLGSKNKRENMKAVVPDRDKESKYYATYPPVSEYIGTFDHRTHRCRQCDYEGLMTPNNFWRGRGCPKCADSGFDKTAPAILYYLRITTREGKRLYKIGITNRTVRERYDNSDLSVITPIKEWRFQVGEEAHKKEQEILMRYSTEVYEGQDVLKSGNTELFAKDILSLDTH